MAFMSGDMQTTVTIGGNAMPLQAAVDQAVTALSALSTRLDGLSAQSESTGFSLGNLGQVFTSSGFSLQGLLSVMGLSSGPLGAFTGLIGQVAGGIGSMIEQATAFVGAMAGWQILQTVISWVQQLSDELFNLQVQTQRMDTSWQYLFGGPTNGGVAASQSVMSWTSQFSKNIPFTRQDLMQAVTTLAPYMNPQQIEQFMPYLSDLTATYGSAKNLDLYTAAQAVIGALNGRSMMLRYEMLINPQELRQYGLQATGTGYALHITDPNSLFRSLENFANAKHVAGASGNIVNTTWWGGWSSLVDNMQNFLLQMGGTNLNGTIQPGSFFAILQQHLDGLLKWFGDHKDEIKHFADLVSHLLGDVTNAGGGMIGELLNWLNKLGAVQWLQNGITSIDQFVTHPPAWFAATLGDLGQFAGQLAQFDWSAIGDFFSGLAQNGPAIGSWVKQIADDMVRFFTTMTPDERAQLQQFFKQLGVLLGTNLLTALELIDTGLKSMQIILPEVLPLLNMVLTVSIAIGDTYLGWAIALQQSVTLLQQLNGVPPGHAPQNSAAYGQARNMGGYGSPSVLPTNATQTPGGYRQFGATGSGTVMSR